MTARPQTADRKLSLAAIRRAVANYMATEGCGCCSPYAAHKAHEARLAKLLRVPMYSDKSGYDFGRFRSLRCGVTYDR